MIAHKNFTFVEGSENNLRCTGCCFNGLSSCPSSSCTGGYFVVNNGSNDEYLMIDRDGDVYSGTPEHLAGIMKTYDLTSASVRIFDSSFKERKLTVRTTYEIE